MSYRKVQKTSKGTYLISLPKEWATQFSLDKQEALLVTEGSDGSLIIKPPQAKNKEIRVTLRMAPYISRHITWSYLMGADLVEVIGNGPITKKERTEIKEAISRLAGFEIIDEKEDRVTIGTLMEAGPGFIDKYLRKELFVTTGMEREAVDAFLKGDAESAQDVKERDDEVDRLYFLLVRLTRGAIGNAYISERLEISPLLALDIREASEVLENLADYAVKVAGSVTSQRVLGPKEEVSVRTFLSEVMDVQGRAIEALLSNAFQDVPSLLERRTKLEELLKFETTGEGCDIMRVLTFEAIMEQVLERTYDLVDLVVPKTIDMTLDQG
ncbi:phosphate uptake regulator PhoU [Tardisphaera miroshnichenkoae]